MNDGWHERGNRRDGDEGGLVFGLLLILAGAGILLANVTGYDLSRWGWPLWIIVPGAALLVLGLVIRSEGGLGAAIPGGLILSTGLLLAFQEATDSYASWSYAWALIAPGSVGATLFLFGLTHARLDLVDAGLRTLAVGIGLFVGFGIFFEYVVGLGATHPNTVMRDSLPIFAVVIGGVIVVFNLLPKRDHEDAARPEDTTRPN